MGKVTQTQVEEYSHERDDLLDDLAKLEEAGLKGNIEQVIIQRKRISRHLSRIEELARLAKLLEEN